MQRLNGSKSSLIPQELLDDIASRFLFDAPEKDLKDHIRLCFLTELAYWFYLDEYVEKDDTLNTIKFDSFALQLFQHVGIEPVKGGTLEGMLQEFREFKQRVPTYGALILNTDLSNVLLVQGFCHRASWGFPKGKINVDEEPHKCAIREVLEETGYDISSQINKDIFLETTIGEQKVRLYIIPGVPMTTEFVPRTKGEIKELRWFPIHQLPAHKNDRNYSKASGHTNMFYMVMPFIKPLREWLALKARSGSVPNDQRMGNGGREARKRHRSLNANNETHQRYMHYNSPCPVNSASFTDVAKSKSQMFFPSLLQEANFQDKSKMNADVSPRKRESKSKSKGKKNYSDANIDDGSQQKFTFKSRGKSKGGHSNLNNNFTSMPNSISSVTNSRGTNATTWNQSSNGFKCSSWENFRINKKAINEALDKVWSGVTIHVKMDLQ